jgi:hypothetical protein
VTSWRDSASQQAQDDLDALLDATMPFAQQMLEKRGEFFPYEAAISLEGATRMFAGDPGQGEHPLSTDVIAIVRDGFRHDRDGLRAVAIVADVRTPDSDAVRVELEHRDGHAIAVLLPYSKKRFGRGVEYRPMAASTSTRQVWSEP